MSDTTFKCECLFHFPLHACAATRLNFSDKKLKRDDKAKKATPQDHLKHIPFRLREIMKSKERMKAGPLKSKKQKEGEVEKGLGYFFVHEIIPTGHKTFAYHVVALIPKTKPEGDSQDGDIPVPRFKRRKNENVKAYLQRMERGVNHVLFLTKNQVERKPELKIETGKTEKKKE